MADFASRESREEEISPIFYWFVGCKHYLVAKLFVQVFSYLISKLIATFCYHICLTKYCCPTSSKRDYVRKRRRRNWKYCRWKNKQGTTNTTQRRTSKVWDSDIQDLWEPPNGDKIADMFQLVCDKCPDFYQIGLSKDLYHVPQPEFGFFFGNMNSVDNMFLPDRKGFLYYNEALKDLPIIFDSGATISVTPSRQDFETFTPLTPNLHNILGNTEVIGVGVIKWDIYDDKGRPHVIRTKAYFVPSARVRLFSVQTYLGTEKGSFLIEGTNAFFRFTNDKDLLAFHTFNNSSENGLLALAYLTRAHNAQCNLALNVLAPVNSNLTHAQKELLGRHFKLGHFHIQWIQRLSANLQANAKRYIPVKSNGVSTCILPHCLACRYAKMHVLPMPKGLLKTPSTDGALKKNRTRPGSMVSTNQFVSSVKGRLLHTQGKEKSTDALSGGTVYVDDSSSFIFVQNQVSLRASETVRGKHEFERLAHTCGVDIKSYRGNNGVFKVRNTKTILVGRNSVYCSRVWEHTIKMVWLNVPYKEFLNQHAVC